MKDFLKNIKYCDDIFPSLQGSLPVVFYNEIKNSWPEFEHRFEKNRLNIKLDNNILIEKFTKILFEAYDVFQKNMPDFNKKFLRSQLTVYYAENPLSMTRPLDLRGYHLDKGNKQLVGLWYFKDDYDEAEGGNLILFNPETKRKKEIAYQENFLILFPNTITSWHSVTPRHFGVSARKFINIVVNDDDPKELMHYYGEETLRDRNIIHKETLDDDLVITRYNLLRYPNFVDIDKK